MAEKTTKKTSPKKTEVTEKSLVEQLVDKRQDLFDAKKSHRGGELVNPRVITGYRKDIARLMTKLSAEKLKESN